MPTVETLSREDILLRKAELLASIATSEEVLRERASEYTLTPREAGVLAEIEGLDFLLGE